MIRENGEKFPKIALSLGLDGAFLTINRFLTVPFENKLGEMIEQLKYYANFQGDALEEGKVDLTNKDLDYKLDPTNPEDMRIALDIMEKFYQARYYYKINDFKSATYEKEENLTEKSIEEICNKINFEQRKNYIIELYKSKNKEEAIEQVKKLRVDSIKALDEIRGEKIEDGMYSKFDFFDHNLEITQYGNHNVYPEMIEDNEFGYKSKKIDLDSIEKLSVDDKSDSTALEVIQSMINLKEKSNYYAVYTSGPKKNSFEAPLVELFAAYTQIPEENQTERKSMATKIASYYKSFNDKKTQYEKNDMDISSPRVIEELTEFTNSQLGEIIPERTVEESKISMATYTKNALTHGVRTTSVKNFDQKSKDDISKTNPVIEGVSRDD